VDLWAKQMNNWQLIKELYDMFNHRIMRGVKNEWAIDPYAWDTGLVRMTPIENWFWQDIRHANAVMYPQYPVAGCFLDFANPVAKVGVECDGKAYHLDVEKDRQRDARLGRLGWTIYRISGSDCYKDFDEEEMESSPAANLIKEICKTHGISRNTLPRSRGLVPIGEFVHEALLEHMA